MHEDFKYFVGSEDVEQRRSQQMEVYPMKISIVDTSPVLAGSTAAEAYKLTLDLAAQADQLGYSRYWMAELHGVPSNASTSPEIAIAAIASRTSNLRVGSGAVLFNQRSPYRVAETFVQLNAMFPGRIDLGLGRATAGPLLDFALQSSRQAVATPEPYDDKVVELLHWFDGFEDGHPFAQVPFFDGVAGRPKTWILGSSPASAVVAARLGLRYAFAANLNPGAAHTAMATYRKEFQPSPFSTGLQSPYSILGVSVVCGETEEDALRADAGGEVVRRLAATGRLAPNGVPTTADALDQLGGLPQPYHYTPGRWPMNIAAAPDRLRDILQSMAAEVEADEVIIQDLIAQPEDRLTSYRLLAESFDLRGNRQESISTTTGGTAHV
ncbi:MsnO8 family LLM class oxidoreductase [Streptomyces sp. NPDC001978]|uniref:MsnO8 family LLM class oxidoreductase n=2 Tax=unclassified Streptomyces TaxID=2593676 RepID=UPI0036C9B032